MARSTRAWHLRCFVQVFYSLGMSAAAAPLVAEPVSVMLRRMCVEPACGWSDADLARLRGLAPAALGHDELVDLVGVLDRHRAAIDAVQVAALAVLDRRDPSGFQAVREEVACMLRISPPAAATRLAHARAVVDRLPATFAALAAGDLSLAHVVGLARMAQRSAPALAAHVDAVVVADSAGATPPMLDRAVHRAVALADPAGSADRHADAVDRRDVRVYPEPDGMATLSVYGPAVDVHTVYTRLDAATRLLPRDDARTVPQRRFDLLVDGVLTGIPADGLPTVQGRSPQIQVTIAATTLLGLDNDPGDLAGYGPLDAPTARELAADPTGTWRRILTDPVSGRILDYGRTTYRPPHNLADHITARDRTCRFPGCTVPARRCDLDHAQSWDDGGRTSTANLAALCRRHHRLKTEKIWSYQLDSDATATWTSPSGHHYKTEPEPTLTTRPHGDVVEPEPTRELRPCSDLAEPEPELTTRPCADVAERTISDDEPPPF